MKILLSLILPFLSMTSLTAAELYDQNIKAIDGSAFDFAALKGKTVLFVNVASKCGFTKQYTGLEKLYTDLKDQGFVIVGVPSNDFGSQEPGEAEEIVTFCKTTYGVDFPMTEKVQVKGPEKHPLYVFLTNGRGEPKWNFHKYLVGKDGKVVAEYPSKVTPEDPELLAAIKAELAK